MEGCDYGEKIPDTRLNLAGIYPKILIAISDSLFPEIEVADIRLHSVETAR
jgi:hypothetical protein